MKLKGWGYKPIFRGQPCGCLLLWTNPWRLFNFLDNRRVGGCVLYCHFTSFPVHYSLVKPRDRTA